MNKPVLPIKVFYSYAHQDEALREELEKHLAILERQGFIRGLRRIGTDSRNRK
jgi:hypothetical protein